MPIDIWWRVEINYVRNYNIQAECASDAGMIAQQIWREDPSTPAGEVHTLTIRHAMAREVRTPVEQHA